MNEYEEGVARYERAMRIAEARGLPGTKSTPAMSAKESRDAVAQVFGRPAFVPKQSIARRTYLALLNTCARTITWPIPRAMFREKVEE